MPGSVFGVLARLGLTALDTYNGQGVFALAWVQGLGCLVMGACVGWRDQITAFHPPLYTAIATGFCGSLTTFSSWMLDVFLAFSNGYGNDRIWIYDVMDGLTRTFVTFAISLCGLSLGLHLASYDLSHNHFFRRLGKLHISLPLRLFLLFSSLLIYLLCIPLYFVLSPDFRPLATSALLYSFPGTLMRHILGTQLNGRHPYYPIGTLLANALGTAFLAIFHSLQRLPSSPVSGTSCVVLQGLADGLCGCLSTVSTFAVEVRGMQGRGRQARRAWLYAIGSWVIGQLLMLAILGGSMWGGGAREGDWCVSRL
ncbi:hypothetical protein DACRYDRAFT_73278 [Dacryopinax primogenitus]|uniref:CRCB-domain-containing protein n=1 Tax=Dacryopinax primogenitus (strain DJM 731) TaxID=1858805 RepID=M5GAV4_DACPD|nr:uncharacterized protein DACRYDRAFT_73278 [Dacryopinax primogenitus]EJU06029.1 hypothetical protein DACRYDRAFT_73278 [Dacryopinax primogenitus]